MSQTIVESKGDLSALLDFLASNHIVRYDVETNSLDTIRGKIIGAGFTSGDVGFYIPSFAWSKETEELLAHMPREYMTQALELIKDKKILIDGWNLSFDTRFTNNYYEVNIVDNIWSDGMLLKHTVDEERPFALKEVSKKVFGDDATVEQQEMKASIKANGGTEHEYFKCDMPILAKYCLKDCMLTEKLTNHYLPLLKKEGLENFYFHEEVMPLYRKVTIPMELKGIPLDMGLLNQTKKEIRTDIEALESEIQSDIEPHLEEFNTWFLNKDYPVKSKGVFAQAVVEFGELKLPRTATGKFSLTRANIETLPTSGLKSFLLDEKELHPIIARQIQESCHSGPMFNLQSKHHLKKLFFEKLGCEPVSKTDKGNPQVDHLFLKSVEDVFPFVPKLQNLNKLYKLEGSYIDRFLDKNVDGMYYPSFMQHRTVSGRYGSDIQQLPRPIQHGDPIVVKYNNVMRKLFISGKGYKFIDADYESLEPHVFAHVSGDEGLRNIFRKGHDFYSTIAIKTEGLEGVSADKKADNYLGKVNPELRQKAKAYALGIPYGMEAFALSKTLDVGQSVAQNLINGYLDGFPDLKAWMRRSIEDCKLKGRIQIESGRVRRHPMAPKLYRSYGDKLLDSLELWKEYNEFPAKYSQMKYLRKQLKNALNNSINVQIQALAASIVNRSAVAANQYMRERDIDGYVCAQIHDQLIVRVEDKNAEHMKLKLQEIMENTYILSIPLKAPAEIAENWYDGH